MTDGEMNTPRDNLSHQGLERSLPRIGATDNKDAIARHNNRFRQLCERAKRQGITIWVVSFGVSSNSNLNSCASSGQAYESRSEEHTSETPVTNAHLVCRLLLEKNKHKQMLN